LPLLPEMKTKANVEVMSWELGLMVLMRRAQSIVAALGGSLIYCGWREVMNVASECLGGVGEDVDAIKEGHNYH